MSGTKTFLIIIGISILIACGHLRANKTSEVRAIPENTTNDIEKLLDNTLPFVEDLIKIYGEFFPIASAIKANDSIVHIGTYNGNERPSSDQLIADLKKSLKAKKEEYTTIAIFYNVRVIDPNTNVKTDAIAVFVETKKEKVAFTFYYPYTLTKDNKFTTSNSWKNTKDKEIFKE